MLQHACGTAGSGLISVRAGGVRRSCSPAALQAEYPRLGTGTPVRRHFFPRVTPDTPMSRATSLGGARARD